MVCSPGGDFKKIQNLVFRQKIQNCFLGSLGDDFGQNRRFWGKTKATRVWVTGLYRAFLAKS
jgi:hypothetical protein